MVANQSTTPDDELEFLIWENGYLKGLLESCRVAYEHGLRDGYRDGYRKAKGRKKSTKLTAAELAPFLAYTVNQRAGDLSVKEPAIAADLMKEIAVGHVVLGLPHNSTDQETRAAVGKFLAGLKLRDPTWPVGLPRTCTVLREYFREKAAFKSLKNQ